MALKEKPRSEMDTSDSSAEQDSKVDIMECGNPRDELQEEVILCESSSSSSFGDLMCARDDDDDDGDAQSMLSKDYPLSGTCDVFRKKKVTDEWRRFCQPIGWRCKWLELKVKEIESQARGYEKEVQSYYESKDFCLEKSKVEGFDGKSIPFREQTPRMNVFKRGRRKRVEETTDVDAYMSNHNIFSYADKRTPAATLKPQNLDPGRKATMKEDGIEADCLVSELDCSDGFLGKILCKIDEAQEKARSLRKRVDQLMFESQTAQTIQNSVQDDIPLEEPMREATVQIGRQRISAEDISMMPQAPCVEIGGQCLNNRSPGDLRFHPLIEDLLMDESEMVGDETELDNVFSKLMNAITGEPPVSPDADEDPTPVTKKLSLCTEPN